MARFIFFTKTRWEETPRLRHQLAQLLVSAGHEVLFFERPQRFWESMPQPVRRAERLSTLRHRELLHHRLRLNALLQRANAYVTTRSIASALRPYVPRADDVIVSFNYDYWFLRSIFPANHIVSLINDDFICVALFGYTRPLLWALGRTAAGSDRVLTVSDPLQRQLAPYSTPELFLPWADQPYRAPAPSRPRKYLLFWGYTNRRIEFDAVRSYAAKLYATRPEVRMIFVGPVYPGSEKGSADLDSEPNIEVRPAASLESLPLDETLAAIIPYRPNDLEVDAITLSNKALQLFARGLPLLISALPAMPNFIEQPFVFRMDHRDPAAQIDMIRERFDALQPQIREFVDANLGEARLRQFLSGIRSPSAEDAA